MPEWVTHLQEAVVKAKFVALMVVSMFAVGCGDGVSDHNQNLQKIDAKNGSGAKAEGPSATAAKPSKP